MAKMGTAKFTSYRGDTPAMDKHHTSRNGGGGGGDCTNASSRFMLCDSLMDYLPEAQILPHLARRIFWQKNIFRQELSFGKKYLRNKQFPFSLSVQ